MILKRPQDGECVAYVEILKLLFITKPQSPVELFDALVAAFHNLADGRIWMRWLIFEPKVERYRIMLMRQEETS
jgi:hypothetical protein